MDTSDTAPTRLLLLPFLLAIFALLAGAAPQATATTSTPDGGNVGGPPALASVRFIAPTHTPIGVPAQVTFTLSVRSAFARSAPSFQGQRVASLFRGQTYAVRAFSADGGWVQVQVPGVAAETWVVAEYGAVTGDVRGIPVRPVTVTPTTTLVPPTPATSAQPGVLPVVSARAQEIYRRGLSLGNDPHAFAKVGDCHSILPFFLAAFDNPSEYRLGEAYTYLQEAIDHFSGSFSRRSQAATVGLNTATILNPAWADRRVCGFDESPLACEYRLHRPSLAFISLGTNGGWQTDAEYEMNMRILIEFSMERGVLPILSTKADNMEGGDRFNQIIVRLAQEYGLPLWHFQLAVQDLPSHGLGEDAFHLTWGQLLFDRPEPLQRGWQVRNLTALQALDTVWRAVR